MFDLFFQGLNFVFGIVLVLLGFFWLLRDKKAGIQRKINFGWIAILIGAVAIANNGFQLLL